MLYYLNNTLRSGNNAADTGDIAVIVLDQSPRIAPASLPTAGLLDQLKASHVLKHTRFTRWDTGPSGRRRPRARSPSSIISSAGAPTRVSSRSRMRG